MSREAPQQSVQRIFGSLRDLQQAFFWLQVFSTSQAFSQPAQNPLTQTVGWHYHRFPFLFLFGLCLWDN